MKRARDSRLLRVVVGALALLKRNEFMYSVPVAHAWAWHTPIRPVDRRKVMDSVSSRALIAAATTTTSLVGVTPAVNNAIALMSPVSTENSAVRLEPSGVAFPLVSFGLQVYNDDTAYKLTLTALEVGYRNFFASVLAGNQRGFARAVRDSGIPRSELFICGSVVSDRARGFEQAKQLTTQGWKENMKSFAAGSITYLDQIMLDYPGPDCVSIRGQWRAFEEMHTQQYTKTLSVSNFSPAQLDCILQDPDMRVKPVVNQLPYSVAYHPSNVVADNVARGILVQAWAPLGGSFDGQFDARIKAACSQIGAKYTKSYAQVALRWLIQKGVAVCTQTKNKDHFIEDLALFDFNLSDEDMKTLEALYYQY